MFDFLKKKINEIGSLFSSNAKAEDEKKPIEEKIIEKPEIIDEQKREIIEAPKEAIIEKPVEIKEIRKEEKKIIVKETPEAKGEEPKIIIKEAPKIKEAKFVEAPREERKIAANLDIVKHITGTITGKVVLDKKYIDETLENLEMALLESDVALEVADHIKENMEKEMQGKSVYKNELDSFIKNSIRDSLEEIMVDAPDLISEIKKSGKKPYIIVLFGLNGSGKTTTLAKLAHMLKKNNLSVIAVAADTFRAASIEQLAHHGEKVGFEVIKANYGSDPTAVTFDGVKHAQAKGIDVVIVDTAGRQNINKNLMKEREKMMRVINPDLRLFIGEAISGNALYDAVREYEDSVGIQGVILTKMDLDAKGGTAISVSKALNVPIYFMTYGQKYDDIEVFKKEKIIDAVFE
ncbi:MAG: signal recognition particle-docking protein FtsY [Candidatus Micrarchaeota archaeon]|nr:signal recognition particle-docking protein FtsY [Candidatus Micrarchaeota archaeon]